MSPRTAVMGRAGLAVVLAAVAGGCATKRDVRDVRADVRAASEDRDSALQAVEQEMRDANRATQDSIRAVADLFFDFRGGVNSQLAGILQQLQQLNELAGQIQRSQAALRDQLEAQRWQPPPAQQAAPPPSDSLAPGSDESGPAAADPAAELYEAAVRQINLGSFAVAKMGFTRFLEEHPNHPLSPGAYLHLGELESAEDRLDEAAETYLRVPELFPAAEEVPSALYRAAMIYIQQESFGQARELLERIVNSYGGHRFASMAEERLRELP